LTVKSYERPTQWLPLVQPFSQENQMLTPKLSLRRTIVAAVYQDKVEALYAGQGNKVPYRGGAKLDE
jgi:long-subunit acyl-CoA synthetase (AMP-forming)